MKQRLLAGFRVTVVQWHVGGGLAGLVAAAGFGLKMGKVAKPLIFVYNAVHL